MNNKLQIETNPRGKSKKIAKLVLGIIFDLIGMSSYTFEPITEILDIAWAPISGFLLARMYKGNVGKIAGTIDFIEELMPGTDFIPTFTLTWIYVYIIKKEA